MLASAAVPRSHIRLHFKRSTPTVATLHHARRALLADVAQQLEDLDRWIKATGIKPKTYGDQLCAAIIEHRCVSRAATALNAQGVKTPDNQPITGRWVREWMLQYPGSQRPVNWVLFDLALRLCLGTRYGRTPETRAFVFGIRRAQADLEIERGYWQHRQFASTVRAAMEVRS